MTCLADVLERLEGLAPLRLAAEWDNVGLLLEGTRAIERVFLTVDLTPAVVDEALQVDADLIVAYHPPIFMGLKRLTEENARDVLRLVRAGVHVYSPHTALDAAVDGMGDWLLDAFQVTDRAPITPDAEVPQAGLGRVGPLLKTLTPDEAAAQVKTHLGLAHVRMALGSRPIRRVAVCPGAGGSAFEGLSDIDLLLTGEMRHHDVLGWVKRGTTVILTDHTNTERGFLPHFAARLSWSTHVSAVDADPLVVY